MKKWFYWTSLSFAIASLSLNAAGFKGGERVYIGSGCIACHGAAGHSPDPKMYPKIAGLDRAYIIEQLNAFREGERSNAMMSPMAMSLSDADIMALADYLAVQK